MYDSVRTLLRTWFIHFQELKSTVHCLISDETKNVAAVFYVLLVESKYLLDEATAIDKVEWEKKKKKKKKKKMTKSSIQNKLLSRCRNDPFDMIATLV